MTEQRYVVPEGMLKAADEAIGKVRSEQHEQLTGRDGELWPNDLKRISIEAALLWLRDNTPIGGPTGDYVGVWLDRMFLAPEPEIPEAIQDLQVNDLDMGWDGPINKRILEAYRRGKASK
jgi:hypothetical protein